MIQCPICGKNEGFNFVESWQEYKLYHCQACDVVFSDPMRNPGSEWYEQSELYTLGKVLPQVIAWHHNQFLQDERTYGEDLLDVGCGTGFFAGQVQKCGYKVVGIDFDKDNIKIAQEQFGLSEAYPLTLEEFIKSFPNKKFDVITFFETLEHTDNPNGFIESIKTILKPNGYIALSAPNRERFVDPLGKGDYPPNHLTRWSAFSLRSFLEKRGFEIVRLVIKELDANDVAGSLKSKIKFRIAHRMAQSGKACHDPTLIHRATALMKIKDLIFKGLTTPLAPLLRFLKLQGMGLYCVARLK